VAAYQVFEALADPTRRGIFESLAGGPQAVVDIAALVPISRPAVSQHLRVLKEAGLVSVQAAGTRRLYSVDPAGVTAARDYFSQFWSTALKAYARAAVGKDTAGAKSTRHNNQEKS
jgi:DNA-binding transcriptional ArsR family regulator